MEQDSDWITRQARKVQSLADDEYGLIPVSVPKFSSFICGKIAGWLTEAMNRGDTLEQAKRRFIAEDVAREFAERCAIQKFDEMLHEDSIHDRIRIEIPLDNYHRALSALTEVGEVYAHLEVEELVNTTLGVLRSGLRALSESVIRVEAATNVAIVELPLAPARRVSNALLWSGPRLTEFAAPNSEIDEFLSHCLIEAELFDKVLREARSDADLPPI